MQSLDDIDALFANGGDIAADMAEDLCAGAGAECPRDFLLDFDHAQVTFSEIVIEGDPEITHEGQCFSFVPGQTVQEIFRRRLFFTPALAKRAVLAGTLGMGVYGSLAALEALPQAFADYAPTMDAPQAETLYAGWLAAVRRVLS